MDTFKDLLFALDPVTVISLSAVLLTVVGTCVLYASTIRYPPNLPLVREKEGVTRFSLKTRLAYYTDCQNLFKDAYEKFSKNGRTCLIPGLGFRSEIILPNRDLAWLIAQPDRVLSSYEAFVEMDQVQYSMGHTKFIRDPWQGMLIKRDMNNVLEAVMVALSDELQFAFNSRFADTNEWTEFTALETMRRIIAQGSSRFTVGLPLCRNEQYLEDTTAYGDLLIFGAGSFGIMPKFLRPVLVSLVALPIRYRAWKIKNVFKPEYEKRFESIKNPKSENDPQDHLQMMFRYAQSNRPAELNLGDMTLRLAVSNFGSYHQTSLAMTNMILDIIASDEEYNTMAILREEISAVLAVHNNSWTKAAISQMVKADSVCRETLRLSAFGNRAIIRMVMVDGLRTEDGITLPKGATVSVLADPAQRDTDIFTNPSKFDPFRFSRIREDPKSSAEAARTSFVSTGSTFLPFGHGRHACPGRFLLDFELKMMLAYMLMNYDLAFPEEYKGQRPKSPWMAEAKFPPSDARILVKRRKTTT